MKLTSLLRSPEIGNEWEQIKVFGSKNYSIFRRLSKIVNETFRSPLTWLTSKLLRCGNKAHLTSELNQISRDGTWKLLSI